jgi:large subunit ribosomal protein L31e
MERIYTIPLKDAKRAPKTKRAAKAMRFVKDFMVKHMKSEEITLDASVNEKIWQDGIRSIPSKIKVKAEKLEDGKILVTLAE